MLLLSSSFTNIWDLFKLEYLHVKNLLWLKPCSMTKQTEISLAEEA